MGIVLVCVRMYFRSKSSDTLDYDEVRSYDGETKLGFRHGRGLYLYENGDMYDGMWEWDKKHGYGTYTRSDQSKLTGYFYKDKYIGTEPGDHFAQKPIREANTAKPLPLDQPEVRIVTREEENQRIQRQQERARKRNERSERREELRQKYNL